MEEFIKPSKYRGTTTKIFKQKCQKSALQNNTELSSSIHVGNLQSRLTTTLFKTSGVGLNASHEDTDHAKSLAAAGILLARFLSYAPSLKYLLFCMPRNEVKRLIAVIARYAFPASISWSKTTRYIV